MSCLGLAVLCGCLAPEAAAQRPERLRSYDGFYRGESARRSFFDAMALTGEISYRPGGNQPQPENPAVPLSRPAYTLDGETPAAAPAPATPGGMEGFGLSFRLDYALNTHFDLSAILDATGGLHTRFSDRMLRVSWLALKHYRHVDGTDYAFRIAVDPAKDGGLGFRQTDVAFLATSNLTPLFMSDFALGWRRVRHSETQPVVGSGSPDEDPFPQTLLFWRAIGQELHLMMSYRLLFDPAESHFLIALMYEGGSYDLLETSLPSIGQRKREDFHGGVSWVRFGAQWNRPSYQISPFFNVPLKRWGQGVSRTQFGIRLTIR